MVVSGKCHIVKALGLSLKDYLSAFDIRYIEDVVKSEKSHSLFIRRNFI